MSRDLTHEERALLRAVQAYQTRLAGQTPSKDWLATCTGASRTTVHRLLDGLERRGMIRREGRDNNVRRITICAEETV